jgi:hypothetical protein
MTGLAMMDGWWELFTAAAGGGAAFKVFEIGYREARDWFADRSKSTKLIEANLEPLLKACDELVGKLRSLAEKDFLPLRNAECEGLDDHDFASVVYLFVQFWAWVEIIRLQSFDRDMGRSKTGKQLTAFSDCLESRRVRLIDRMSQRAVGESAISDGRAANFVQFVQRHDESIYIKRWINPLCLVLKSLDDPKARQRTLQYAVVLHAMIDTLDPDHHITRDIPATPNKLTKKSWRDLEYRVFGVYLKFVKGRAKYIGPPKGRP